MNQNRASQIWLPFAPKNGPGDAYVGFNEGYWKDMERYFIITVYCRVILYPMYLHTINRAHH
jgi:hypothetical protein